MAKSKKPGKSGTSNPVIRQRRTGKDISAAVEKTDPNLRKRRTTPTAGESAVGAIRMAHGNVSTAINPDGGAAATASMRYAGRARSGDVSQPRPDGGVGAAVSD